MKFATVSPEIERAFTNKMNEVLALCEAKHGGTRIPAPRLLFRRLGLKAGLCRYPNMVFINTDYFKSQSGYDEQLNDTLPHEVAHYVACYIYGTRAHGHGDCWRTVMYWMGIRNAKRCHALGADEHGAPTPQC